MSKEPEIIEVPETDELVLLRKENESLAADLEQLRAENRKLGRSNRWLKRGYRTAGFIGSRAFLGPDLPKAVGRWLEKSTKEERIPKKETADVFVAAFRHLRWMEIIGLVVTVLTLFLLFRQNMYFDEQNGFIEAQNQYFQEQNEKIQRQLDDQAADTRIVRRAQLLDTIYELSDCDRSELEAGEACPPRASHRLRWEAVRALARVDGDELDLRHADLRATSLREVDLGGADLYGANLDGADLQYASLVDSELSKADLSNAKLFNAELGNARLDSAKLVSTSLSYAKLIGANLQRANLDKASLRGAKLGNANLRGADLANADLDNADLGRTLLYEADLGTARNSTQSQLAEACGDSETQIPTDLERPEHWLDRPWKYDDPKDAGCPPEPADAEAPTD